MCRVNRDGPGLVCVWGKGWGCGSGLSTTPQQADTLGSEMLESTRQALISLLRRTWCNWMQLRRALWKWKPTCHETQTILVSFIMLLVEECSGNPAWNSMKYLTAITVTSKPLRSTELLLGVGKFNFVSELPGMLGTWLRQVTLPGKLTAAALAKNLYISWCVLIYQQLVYQHTISTNIFIYSSPWLDDSWLGVHATW